MLPIPSVIVAGHVCLDIVPRLDHLPPGSFATLLLPGRFVEANGALFLPGGAVANTGLALYRLGVPVRLVARIGADMFGRLVREQIAAYAPRLDQDLIVDPQTGTAYTFILDPPGSNRTFIHCPGTNDTFCEADVSDALLADCAVLHIGYPTIMRRMYADAGAELEWLLRRALRAGATTVLDVTLPDPSSPRGQIDWQTVLRAVLPHVGIFTPTIEEALFLLRRAEYDRLAASGPIIDLAPPALVEDLAAELLDLGAAIVFVKRGPRGSYLRSSTRTRLQALGRLGPFDPGAWANRRIWTPSFRVAVAGTTGAGDAAIAGLLAAILRGADPASAATMAAAVAACSVEQLDVLSGIRTWNDTTARILAGWEQVEA